MKEKRILFLAVFLFTMLFSTTIIYAGPTSTSTCTHDVYDTNNSSTYHYYYCNTCGECYKRVAHSTNSVSNYRK